MRVYPDIWTTPFGKSPITFFVGRVTAPLALGKFTFDGTATDFITRIPLVPQSLYWFLDWNFSVDIAVADYTAALDRIPVVSVYQKAKPNEPVFRQPFPVPVYYENKWLLQGFRNVITPNELLFSVDGTVKQSAALVGKQSLTATLQFTAYEVTDPDYIARFMDGLDVPPPPPRGGAGGPSGGVAEDLARVQAQNPEIRMAGGVVLPGGR